MQPVTGRYAQIRQAVCGVNTVQLPDGTSQHIARQPARLFSQEQILGMLLE
jgi:hypothetical protein